MRKIASISAVMAITVFVFSGYALARGGNSGSGRGSGAFGNCPKQSAASAARPACDGTGPRQRLTTTQARPMDGTGYRKGQMHGSGSSTQTVPQDAAAPTAN